MKDAETRIESLLARMTWTEKAGQMSQLSFGRHDLGHFDERVERGLVGSFLNAPSLDERNRTQRVAVERSRLGIPLLFGRDVIHGHRTIFPLPLGQAASFDPSLAERCACIAAREASEVGIDWTFAPMVDVGRDPRWGRVAETSGEDPFLAARMGEAMVRGFQGDDPSARDRVAACAKHFAGYATSEGGKDYSTAWIPELSLREVHLPPFEACVKAGVLTLMSAFTDLNGTPATANEFLLTRVLRGEWDFQGFVVSDWGSTAELVVHGFSESPRAAAVASVRAGLDMEMAATTFLDHLPMLVESGVVDPELVDRAVRRILAVKMRLGLFERPYVDAPATSSAACAAHLETARAAARESCVLLQNDGILPLAPARRIALIGCLADDPKNQLGCWAHDGDVAQSVTVRAAFEQRLGPNLVEYAAGVVDTRSDDESGFAAAVEALERSDVGVVVLGEHWNISGEARSRAFLDLPGRQLPLLERLLSSGKPLVAVVLSGRPLCLGRTFDRVGALLFAFHPGSMTGPALVDLLLGERSPSGKLPMTFPRAVGQIPIYYAARRGGRPPTLDFRGIPEGTPLDPVGFEAGYLDVETSARWPFGFGLSYSRFEISEVSVDPVRVAAGEHVTVSCVVANVGGAPATEVVQVYLRDVVGSTTRPFRELAAFDRVELAPGERRHVAFTLRADALSHSDASGRRVVEPGRFEVYVGGDSRAPLGAHFDVIARA